MSWGCPKCGRSFARVRQSHSCKRTTVDVHFAGKNPALRDVFDLLTKKLSKTGPLRVDSVKTAIHFVSGRAFGGVTVARESMRLGFLSERPISSPRIAKRIALAPDRIEHVVVINSVSDVDRELLAWLTASQRFRA
jgi:hypothetical protein